MQIGDLKVDIDRKAIKNLHIAVHPPEGRVRVAAPETMSLEAIRIAVSLRLAWIRRQQAKFHGQARQTKREMVSGETHYFLGRGYRLLVERRGEIGRVRLEGDRIRLTCPATAMRDDRLGILNRWYRRELRALVKPKAAEWARKIGVLEPTVGIRKMKTMWGACNSKTAHIWLNLDLIKKSMPCIEYVIVHEIAHLVSDTHDALFIETLERAMPIWRHLRQELNEAPLAHETW